MRPSARARKLLVLLAAVALAGCSAGGERVSDEQATAAFDEVLAAIEGLEGEERERKLVELAEAEGGELHLYTSLTTAETALAEAFGDAYDIDVSVYRARSETIGQRVTEELSAGFRGADVVETNGPEMQTLAGAGAFADYSSPQLANLLEGSEQKGWVATRFVTFVVSWNTEIVSAGQEPRTYESLAEPEWRGELALEAGDADWYKTIREHWVDAGGKSEEEADRLLEAVARNSRVVSGHSLMSELLGAGEYAVAVTSYLYLAQNSIDDGAPVSVTPFVEPLFTRPQGAGIVRTARHPATAMLFVDWLLGPGQEILKENNIEPARSDIASVQGANIVFIDVEGYVAEQREWQDRYERLLSLASQSDDG